MPFFSSKVSDNDVRKIKVSVLPVFSSIFFDIAEIKFGHQKWYSAKDNVLRNIWNINVGVRVSLT
jgi:hypothetical protein